MIVFGESLQTLSSELAEHIKMSCSVKYTETESGSKSEAVFCRYMPVYTAAKSLEVPT